MCVSVCMCECACSERVGDRADLRCSPLRATGLLSGTSHSTRLTHLHGETLQPWKSNPQHPGSVSSGFPSAASWTASWEVFPEGSLGPGPPKGLCQPLSTLAHGHGHVKTEAETG